MRQGDVVGQDSVTSAEAELIVVLAMRLARPAVMDMLVEGGQPLVIVALGIKCARLVRITMANV